MSINWELALGFMSKEAESESLIVIGRVRGSLDPKSISYKEEEQGKEEPKTIRQGIFKENLKSNWEER